MSSRPLPHPALQLLSVHTPAAPVQARHHPVARHEVVFTALYRQGHGLAFPCDESGAVDVDALPLPARRNYLAACERVGRDYALPQVRAMAGFTH